MIGHQDALIYTMVLLSAADGDMTDSELHLMTEIVRHLPVFKGFDVNRLPEVAQNCASLLTEDDGLDQAIGMIAKALNPSLRETAYALACDVAAADGSVGQEESRLLEMLRHGLSIGRLVAAAIERGARARFMTV